ncbi:SRPBCC family protein [Sphingobacterium lactis]|uniref:SRPBCC family protein n=1 Tax=Sphingobacterium lactis TaxID=797291 RepID=UPI003DA2E3A6
MTKKRIQIDTSINAPVTHVWDAYNTPEDIKMWNHASDDWECPSSENDLRVGGKFKNKMAAKDGSFSFDFEGTYTEVTPNKSISYVLGDERQADITFQEEAGKTNMKIVFDADDTHDAEMQRSGWQSILDNFRKHVESK